MAETNSEQPAAESAAVDEAPPGEAALQKLPSWGSGSAPSIPSVDNDDHVSLNAKIQHTYRNCLSDQRYTE
jgi:hypothetical protein